jgi:tripartite-type tricarboxylate transporter receptor subunit TctC
MTTRIAAIAAAALAWPLAVEAQQPAYPSRPVRIVVGFTPASSNDILARFVGTRLGERLGQQVVVENRPGANGIIGSDLTAKATPDGHTLLLVSTSHTMNAAIQSKLPFDAVASFVPIAMLGAGPLVLVAHPSFQASTPKALVEIAKAKPGTINYASAGTGGINHFAGALFSRTAGVEMTHVPYKGGAPALTDVIGGQVHIMFGSMPLTLRQVRAGKVKALGVTSPRRSPQLPEMPTIAEAGVPGYEISLWWGILAPAGVPPAIVTRLNREISDIVGEPASMQRLEAEGATPWRLGSAEFRKVIESEVVKWRRVAREANIRPE